MLSIKQIGMVMTAALLFWGASFSPVNAQYYSQGETKVSLIVDKKVKAIKDVDYVDNIDKNTKVFLDGDIIEFNIKVENNSNQDMDDINVVDILPSNLELIFYPGIYNKNNTISWKIEHLKKGESKSYQIRAKIKNISFDGKKTNVAEARKDSAYDKDQAVYYVGVKTVPVTGNNSLIINSVLGLSGAMLAFGIRKFARGY